MVTAVEETSAPAAAAISTPRWNPEITDGRIAQERDAGENDRDDPDFARIDAAERTDRIARHHRQRDERHRKQHDDRAQLVLIDLAQPSMHRLAQRQQTGGGYGNRAGHRRRADQRIGPKRECQKAGDRGGRREGPSGPVLLNAEKRNDHRIAEKGQAQHEAAGNRTRSAQRLRGGSGEAAEQAGDRERADPRRTAAGLFRPLFPSALKPDQQADPERRGEVRELRDQIHRPLSMARMPPETILPCKRANTLYSFHDPSHHWNKTSLPRLVLRLISCPLTSADRGRIPP
ncbi:MAG: hypothetical protein M5U33_05750 [Pseudorhodoplanes sp.]|nr:hypothetical protein [Pseudorhodoplanes sp.]